MVITSHFSYSSTSVFYYVTMIIFVLFTNCSKMLFSSFFSTLNLIMRIYTQAHTQTAQKFMKFFHLFYYSTRSKSLSLSNKFLSTKFATKKYKGFYCINIKTVIISDYVKHSSLILIMNE